MRLRRHMWIESGWPDPLCGLKECNCTIIQLHREKQQLVEHNEALEEGEARFTAKLTKVSVRLAAGEVNRKD